MVNLHKISTLKLARELSSRPDLGSLLRLDGLLSDSAILPLRTKLSAVVCVDSIAVRRNEDNSIAGGVIRRGTGKCRGRLAFIGGTVGLYEPLESAIKRHWQTDLGLEVEIPLGWKYPVCMAQYAPQVNGKNRPEFDNDPTKHSVASTHLVYIKKGEVTFGVGIGGQEATEFVWHTIADCPLEEEWAYTMRDTFIELLTRAEELAGNVLKF